MSDPPETPQQRQARIRQQKREAKIKAQGQERLDKITALSGRTPESMRNDSPAQTQPAPQSPTPASAGSTGGPFTSSMFGQTNDPEQMRLQEEYMRALLGGTPQAQAVQEQQRNQAEMPGEDDPMMKMMQQMLAGMSGDPNMAASGEIPSFSPDDISKLTGIPSFLTSMFMGGKQGAPPTPQEISRERTWKILRVIISIVTGLYTILTIDRSVEGFGQNPPAPATVQNPFVVFCMGELLVNGARTVLSGRPASQSGFKAWIQAGREVGRDGAILVFVLGLYSWWKGYT